jgi:hypothetical protein
MLLSVLLLSGFLKAQYKVDSMCGAKVNLDKGGKLLARYKPQTPGASYTVAVKLAVDFLKIAGSKRSNVRHASACYTQMKG